MRNIPCTNRWTDGFCPVAFYRVTFYPGFTYMTALTTVSEVRRNAFSWLSFVALANRGSNGSRTSAVAKTGNRRRTDAGGGCMVKDGARTSERLASCHVYRRSVGAGQRLLIATPDCKSTRRAAEAWMPQSRSSPGLAHRASWAVSLPSTTTSRYQRMFAFVLQGEHSTAFEQTVTGGNTLLLVKFETLDHVRLHRHHILW